MRKLIYSFMVIGPCLVFGQRPDVLIGNDYESISGFGGVFISVSPLDGDLVSYTGGGGAVLLDNAFYFGGYGMGLNDDRRVVSQDGIEYDVDFGHGGFLFGYNIKPENLVHFGVGTKLGWGSLDFHAFDPGINSANDQVFIVYPQFELEFNMTHWFKLNLGAGYQHVVGVDNVFYDQGDVSGAAFGVSFLFGWFY